MPLLGERYPSRLSHGLTMQLHVLVSGLSSVLWLFGPHSHCCCCTHCFARNSTKIYCSLTIHVGIWLQLLPPTSFACPAAFFPPSRPWRACKIPRTLPWVCKILQHKLTWSVISVSQDAATVYVGHALGLWGLGLSSITVSSWLDGFLGVKTVWTCKCVFNLQKYFQLRTKRCTTWRCLPILTDSSEPVSFLYQITLSAWFAIKSSPFELESCHAQDHEPVGMAVCGKFILPLTVKPERAVSITASIR